jgi:predicted ATPase
LVNWRRNPAPALLDALLHQLEVLAQKGPVLMVFEDAHWVDPSSRELLDLTIDRVARIPVLLVMTFRPEFQRSWSGQPYVTIMALNRLGERESTALVERLAGDAGLSRELVDEILIGQIDSVIGREFSYDLIEEVA